MMSHSSVSLSSSLLLAFSLSLSRPLTYREKDAKDLRPEQQSVSTVCQSKQPARGGSSSADFANDVLRRGGLPHAQANQVIACSTTRRVSCRSCAACWPQHAWVRCTVSSH